VSRKRDLLALGIEFGDLLDEVTTLVFEFSKRLFG
jgi:hypothetical protein